MRLPKIIYIIEEIQGELVGFDQLGRPIYGEPTILKTPISSEVEPFSSKLAETRYGVFVDVTNRVFCKPHEKIVLNQEIEFENEDYRITEVMKYDRHYEVLIKKV